MHWTYSHAAAVSYYGGGSFTSFRAAVPGTAAAHCCSMKQRHLAAAGHAAAHYDWKIDQQLRIGAHWQH
jgi:hypothetical protein